MSETCGCGAIHPDLIQTWNKQVSVTTPGTVVRYEIYPNACYILSARLSPARGVTEFEVNIYTSPAPDDAGDDEDKIPLYVDTTGRPDDYRAGDGMGAAALFCENGAYAACDATTGGDDAYLQVRFVPRLQFCPAFPYPEQTLQKCWEEAHPGVPIYENFWNYERDNSEEDTGGSGGGGGTGSVGVPL